MPSEIFSLIYGRGVGYVRSSNRVASKGFLHATNLFNHSKIIKMFSSTWGLQQSRAFIRKKSRAITAKRQKWQLSFLQATLVLKQFNISSKYYQTISKYMRVIARTCNIPKNFILENNHTKKKARDVIFARDTPGHPALHPYKISLKKERKNSKLWCAQLFCLKILRMGW